MGTSGGNGQGEFTGPKGAMVMEVIIVISAILACNLVTG